MSSYYITSFEFENYLSIKSNEPKIIEYDESFENKLNCQFDFDNSKIICFYIYSINNYLKYREIKKSEKNYTLITEIILEKNFGSNYGGNAFSFSKNIVFVCFSESDNIKCYFKKNLDNKFKIISYDFENQCLELKTF